MAPPRLWLSILLGLVVVTVCPRRFDPRASEIHSQNPEAEIDFRSAHRKWQEGDFATAAAGFRQFLGKYGPNEKEPLAPLARFELGLCEYRLGQFDEARRLLAPFSSQILEGAEATELHAVLADLHRRDGEVSEALREYELYYRSAQIRPLEQAYVRSQVTALLSKLPASEQPAVRARFGLPPAVSASAAPRRLVVGLALPLSGKDRALGERVLRGALSAAQVFAPSAGAGAPAPTASAAIDLRVRDSALGPAAAVSELVREGAQAIVGSPVRAEASAMAAEADKRGAVMLHLAALPASGAAGRSFQLLRSNEARAEALAEYLAKSGLKTVAVLAPATPYGQSMTRAFVSALAATGGAVKVVAQLDFPATATTFTAQARKLLELAPQAVYVPATVAQLELVSAQLAAIGALSTYRVEKREAEPPVKLLLSSAEGMGERLLKNAGRYLQGAILAPISPGGAPLLLPSGERGPLPCGALDGGGEPGALDGLGCDAVELLRAAGATCAAGQHAAEPSESDASAEGALCSAAELAAGLQKGLPAGRLATTGPIGFDASGLRGGAPWLLRVEGNSLRPVDASGSPLR
jgi:ABC-type branched-subunit amino acid transport system substrate-binding protein